MQIPCPAWLGDITQVGLFRRKVYCFCHTEIKFLQKKNMIYEPLMHAQTFVDNSIVGLKTRDAINTTHAIDDSCDRCVMR